MFKATVELNEAALIGKVTNDRFGLFVSEQWFKLITPYTPRDNKTMIRTALGRPFEIEYIEPYSHYMYMGELYVDPKTGSPYAEFATEKIPFAEYKKVPTGKPLNYQKTTHPFATDHWDIKAAEAGQLSKLYRTLNNALNTGRY